MATIRFQLPDKPEPTVIPLHGKRIRIGRRPDNTVQLLDRSLSAHHAELFLEDGYYRLRDLDSTNGTFVNGQQVSDYHLREACTIAFGTLVAQYNATEEIPEPEAVPPHAEIEKLRGELDALLQKLHEAEAQATHLRGELAHLRDAAPVEKPSGVPQVAGPSVLPQVPAAGEARIAPSGPPFPAGAAAKPAALRPFPASASGVRPAAAGVTTAPLKPFPRAASETPAPRPPQGVLPHKSGEISPKPAPPAEERAES